MKYQLVLRGWTASVICHHPVVVCIDPHVRVLGVNPLPATRHPQELDLLILEHIVEMHVLAENILYGTTCMSLFQE